ncbi:uncharacterized protein LOC121917959 [Sceloporus undulatus]|uniref:uncharacterized protein LOC121917959 n=1 Tax=Sceloporus undulatus TaxID=8520 RepID=UPI001C4CF468|nr:uncharacterized protein LOC121917959 [Sceloporus undulatus]
MAGTLCHLECPYFLLRKSLGAPSYLEVSAGTMMTNKTRVLMRLDAKVKSVACQTIMTIAEIYKGVNLAGENSVRETPVGKETERTNLGTYKGVNPAGGNSARETPVEKETEWTALEIYKGVNPTGENSVRETPVGKETIRTSLETYKGVNPTGENSLREIPVGKETKRSQRKEKLGLKITSEPHHARNNNKEGSSSRNNNMERSTRHDVDDLTPSPGNVTEYETNPTDIDCQGDLSSQLDTCKDKRNDLETPPDLQGRKTGDQEATKGTDNQIGINNLDQGGIAIIKLGMEKPACPFCNCIVGKPTALDSHIKGSHGGKKVIYECSKCERKDERVHSTLVHMAKCKNKGKIVGILDGMECCQCGDKFETISGLSQHKRHKHPDQRNKERIGKEVEEESRRNRENNRGKHKSCWTEEEVEQLELLWMKYEGHKNINKLIESELTTKTAKQISDKRRLIELKRKRVKEDKEDFPRGAAARTPPPPPIGGGGWSESRGPRGRVWKKGKGMDREW